MKLDASCTHDIARLAFSQEPAYLKKKREQINGKNKSAEIRMDFHPIVLIYRFDSRLCKEYQWEEHDEETLKMENSFHQIY